MTVHRALMVLVAIGATVGIAACGSDGSSPSAASSAVSSGTPASLSVTPSSSSDKPLAYYAAAYTRIGKTCSADQEKLGMATTNAAIVTIGKKAATDCQAANHNLLTVTWPSKVERDIQVEVASDAPILKDLTDLAANASNVKQDAEVANAAANLTRIDLGLPAID